jgi:D-threo-aldose 1-dehydrogenase
VTSQSIRNNSLFRDRSLLGFGAAPIGNLYRPITDQEAMASIEAALAAGIDYFDTAPHYGFGLSESRLGMALAASSIVSSASIVSAPIISSKVGRLLVPSQSKNSLRHGFADAPALEPVFDYSYDGVMRSFEESLRRLQRESIDILFAHDLGVMTHGDEHPKRFREFMEGGYKAMHALKSSGVVKAIGLGVNEWQICADALKYGDFDGFLLAGRYTLLEQSACENFFPLCEKRNAWVILGGPFNSGILATGVKHNRNQPVHYNYETAPDFIINRVAELETICEEFSVPLAAAALQFPAAHPQIVSVLAGLATVSQVNEAVSLMKVKIPDEFWKSLREKELVHALAPIPC